MSFYMDSGSAALSILSGLFAVPLIALYLSIFFIPAGLVAYRLRGYLPLAAIAFAAVVVLGEYLRSLGLLSFPWNLLGYVWSNDIYLLQLASVGRIFLLSFLVLSVSAFVAIRSWGWVVSVLVLLAAYGFGYQRLHSDVATLENGAQVLAQFSLVQSPVSQQQKWDRRYIGRDLERHSHLTEKAEGSLFVLWPETAVIEPLAEADDLRQYIAGSLRTGQYLLLGSPRMVSTSEGVSYYNTLFVLDSDGEVVTYYDKKHLVPFGEYVLFRTFLPTFVQNIISRRIDFSSGSGASVLNVDGHKLRPLICFEAVSPLLPGDGEEEVIVVVSNDAWFEGTIGAAQHFSQVKVRAVELKKPLVRAANMGVSTFVDAFGRVSSYSPQNRTGVLLYNK